MIAVGWIGTILVLAAYAYVTRTNRTDRTFHVLNAVGATALAAAAAGPHLWSVVALNVVWFVIAIVGALRTVRAAQ